MISRSTDIKSALRSRQRGFLLNPYRFGGGGGDPYYSNVSLLLHADGTNGSTTFTDNSPSPKTVTAYGNAQIRTAQSNWGGGSALFDGAGDYATISSSTDLEFGSGNATIELFFRPNALPSVAGGLVARDNSSGYSNFSVNYRSSGAIQAYMSFNSPTDIPLILTSSITLSVGTWYHIAFVKSGLAYVLYIDGVSRASGTAASHPPIGLSTQTIIGAFTSSTYFLNGYIDDLRITKGVARYTANFTPPAAAFPNS